MSKDLAILSQLDATAERGVRPERAKAALADVPALSESLFALEEQLTRATDDAEEKLKGAARHLVSAGGKRIRPMVTLLSCGACGGAMRAAVPYAVAAELTHSATLLHDDVIDDGPVRRGQPASRVIWGNAVSVLSGDWLLTRALEIVSAEPAHRAALAPLLATMRRLVEGEVLQLSLRGTFAASEQDYLAVVIGKTASLFGWAAAAGAWAAGLEGRSRPRSSASGRGSGSRSSSSTTPSTTPPTRGSSGRSSAPISSRARRPCRSSAPARRVRRCAIGCARSSTAPPTGRRSPPRWSRS